MANKEELVITRYVWIDCEMTGLDIQKDVLLEIATIITDTNLEIIAEGPVLVIHQPEKRLADMSQIVQEMHTKSGLTEDVRASTLSLQEAEAQTFAFIEKHCKKDEASLAGNTIWQDGIFLRKYMPRITDFLNYRIIDVSSLKVLIRNWYPDDPQVKYEKAETHRALRDIQESIEELRHYRQYFFKA